MNIKPAPIPKRIRKPYGFWLKTLLEFLDGDEDCVEVTLDPEEYKSVRSLQCSISSAIHRYKFAISTARVDGRLYLVKKLRGDSDEE